MPEVQRRKKPAGDRFPVVSGKPVFVSTNSRKKTPEKIDIFGVIDRQYDGGHGKKVISYASRKKLEGIFRQFESVTNHLCMSA